MNYRDLNVYQIAYKAAISLHLFLNTKDRHSIPMLEEETLRRLSREILAELAADVSLGGVGYKTQSVLNILGKLDQLFEARRMEFREFNELTEEYNKVLKMLGAKTKQTVIHPRLKPKTEV